MRTFIQKDLNTLERFEIPWSVLKFSETLCPLKHYEVSQTILKLFEHFKISWNIRKSHEAFWNPIKYSEKNWNILKSLKIFWNSKLFVLCSFYVEIYVYIYIYILRVKPAFDIQILACVASIRKCIIWDHDDPLFLPYPSHTLHNCICIYLLISLSVFLSLICVFVYLSIFSSNYRHKYCITLTVHIVPKGYTHIWYMRLACVHPLKESI